jgi:carboxylesterase
LLIPLAAAAVLAFLWWRTTHIRSLTAVTTRRRRLGGTGIVIGGEGFELRREGAPAVLLLHGAGDTPQTLRYLADALFASGFHVAAPLLPGHGRSLRDFARVTADELTEAARDAYGELRRAHEWVGIIGLSMGGALAVQLAAEHQDLPALGLLAPYLGMPPRIERAARLAAVWGPLVPVVQSSDGMSILDSIENERSLAYGVFTAAALRALRITTRRAVALLPRVAAPTLVVQSREDNRISVAVAERAFAALGAREKRLEWISGAAHIITVDFGHEKVIAAQVAWMRARLPSTQLAK